MSLSGSRQLKRKEAVQFTREIDDTGHMKPMIAEKHVFSTTRSLSPKWCEFCERLCFSKTVSKCKICHVVVHKSCREAYGRVGVCFGRRLEELGSVLGPKVIPLKQVEQHRVAFDPSSSCLPAAVQACVAYLRDHQAESAVGIFRLSGQEALVGKLSSDFARGVAMDLDAVPDLEVHTVGGVLKRWLRELPEPVLTFELYDAMMAATELVLAKGSSAGSIEILRKAIGGLPQGSFAVLRAVTSLLFDISQNAAVNMMGASNLAIVFAPTMMWPRSDDPMVLLMGMQRATQFMELLIDNWPAVDAKETEIEPAQTLMKQPSSRRDRVIAKVESEEDVAEDQVFSWDQVVMVIAEDPDGGVDGDEVESDDDVDVVAPDMSVPAASSELHQAFDTLVRMGTMRLARNQIVNRPSAPQRVAPAAPHAHPLCKAIRTVRDRNIDLPAWVEREALANPSGGDLMTMTLEDDGVWSELPTKVAHAVRLTETTFEEHDKNMGAMLAALELDDQKDLDILGLLLTLSERNAERRFSAVRTMIRERQGALKAQNLWLFAGDASSRVRAEMKKMKR